MPESTSTTYDHAATVGEFIQAVEALAGLFQHSGGNESEEEEGRNQKPNVDFGESWWFDEVKQLADGSVLIRLNDVSRNFEGDGAIGEAHQEAVIPADDFLEYLRPFPDSSLLQFSRHWFEEPGDFPLHFKAVSRNDEESDIYIEFLEEEQ